MFDPDFFRNKLILAPMVRIGTLPMRLLALEYGADLVYTEELIDWKLLKTERQENNILDTIDYVDLSNGSVIFRTCKLERDKVILQIGTSDPQRALQTALKVQNDVAGLDINMGCPKSFSITGGMGAALMSNLTKAKAILQTLVDQTSIRISCKIRIFDDREKTLDFVRELQSTGISAIAIHGRTIHERPQHMNHNDIVSYVSDRIDIPVILNGCSKEIDSFEELKKLQKSLKSNSIMIARAAKWNCSIFRADGLLDIETVIRAFLIKSIDYENLPSNTKYCVQNILRELQETPKGKLFLESQTLEQISVLLGLKCRNKKFFSFVIYAKKKRSVWDLQTYFKKKHQERYLKRKRNDESQMHTKIKKTRLNTESVIELDCVFIRSNFKDDKDLPKTKLHTLAKKSDVKPIYKTEQNDKLFRSVVEFDNRQFASRIWEKNKRYAEQVAALVCLCSIGVYDRQSLIENGTLLFAVFFLGMSYQKYINDLAERKSIIIRQVDVDYGDMKNFASYCKQLEKITFEKCSGVHHSMMNDLFRNNRSINEIVFVDCARFGHDCFEHLRSIRSSLRLLDLTGYNLSDCEQSSILRVGLDNLETIIFGYPFRHIHLFYHYYPRCKVIFKLRSDRISDTETEMEKQQALDQVARFRRSREKQMQRTNEIMMGNLTLSENQPSSSAQPSARHVNDRTEKKLLDDYKKEIRRLRRSRIKQQFPRDSSDSSLDSSDTSMSQFGKSTSSSSSSGGAASRNQKRMQKKTERRKSRSPNKR